MIQAARLRRDHDKLLKKHEEHLGIVSSEKFQHDQDEIKCKKLSRKLEVSHYLANSYIIFKIKKFLIMKSIAGV